MATVTQQVPVQAQPQAAVAGNTSLYVGDLDPEVNEAVLFEEFSKLGQVGSVRVCRDMHTKRSLGYAYVNFIEHQQAENALNAMNYKEIKGRPCRIMWSQRDPQLRKSGLGNLFVKGLDASIDNKQLFDTFSRFGNILSVKVATDPVTGDSKGYAYIHYDTVEAAAAAIAATQGQLLGGKGTPLVISYFARKSDRSGQSFTNVFVKNLDESVTEQDLEKMFAPFGAVTSAFLASEDGKSKGFGFVNFDQPEAAQAAINALNDKEFGSKKIYVGKAQTKKEREGVLRSERDKKRSERMHRFQGLNLYVKNLDDTIDDEKLKEFFSQFGNITSAKVMRDEKNVSRGFGFVCFATTEEAQKALNEHNKSFGSKPIFVAMHQPKDQRKSFLEQLYSTRASGAQRMFPQPGVYPPVAYPYPGPVPGARGPLPGQYPYPPMMGQRPGPGQWRGPPQAGARPPMTGAPYPPQAGQPGAFPGAGQRGPRQPRTGGPQQPRVPGAPQQGAPQAGRQQTQANFQFKSGVRNAGGPVQPQQPEAVAQQQIPQPVLQANEPLTPAALAAADPAQQKQILGERLFPLVTRHQPELGPKITGMLLQMDNSEVLHLIESPEALGESIKEALLVLQSAGYGNE
eukprot:TRINITY_DN2801_c0_g1_i1.p1 TRINITY_DN2801_c0_g1~~TRINITY_DN2801_c0_g1_i1.p1  ORF type:complete len:669 (-),score=142.23 TRINITY_DN2801_c0_g1_i1:35-1915(-)